jgi:glycosyltransferase involved in cell wall biosynthesis
VRFLWVGGKRGTPDFLRFEHDLRFCGLTEAVTVVETCPNPLDYFCAMDLFALTSREDPFPLVMLEAGSVGLPVVCFESSGGAREFVEKDAGLIAPYLDTAAMADHILTLAREPGLRREMGANAVHKVRARYTVERQAPKLLEVIRRHLKAPG